MSVLGRKFLQGMKHQRMCYALIPRKDKEGSSEIPLEVSDLLSDFGDIIFENVLEGLPPVRQISHQIDLIPRASLPRIDDLMDYLSGAQYFTKIDLKSGYH